MAKHKLVLGSGGIFFENESDPIIDHIFSLADKRESFVYLPTAGHDGKEDEPIVTHYALTHGFKKAECLYLTDESLTEEDIKRVILGADVIYACGGNLKFLMETWRRRGAIPYLRQAYDNGTVIAGQSSGAMCWCRHGYDNCGIGGRYMFLDCLDFVPYILCPHFEDWPEFLEDVKMQELDGIGIDNDIVISIVDGEYEIVDSHRNPVHSAYYLPADQGWPVIDIVKNHVPIKFE